MNSSKTMSYIAASASILWDYFRSIAATLLTLLSLYIIIVGIVNNKNAAEYGGPGIEMILFISFSYLLFLNEGYQVALLGIKSGKISTYMTQPKVYKIFKLMFEDKDEVFLSL